MEEISDAELAEWARENKAVNATDAILKYLLWKYPDNAPFMPVEDIGIVYDQIQTIIMEYTKPKSFWQRFKEWFRD